MKLRKLIFYAINVCQQNLGVLYFILIKLNVN